MTRLQQIDELTRGIHYHLGADDNCYFFFEYTSRRNYSFSETNQLISNLKKSPLRRGRPEYQHKERAIAGLSALFSGALNADWLKDAVLVPVPPSKMAGDPEYDDRMERICRGIQFNGQLNVKNIVRQTKSYQASSSSGDGRITVDGLLSIYGIDESVANPPPKYIGIVDDVLTAGTHYRAMHTVLSKRFPESKITGLFVARRILPDDDLHDF